MATTLAEMALMVVRIVGEVVEGEATAADATSLTDTENLVQGNQYWDRGTLWFMGGDLDGRLTPVLSSALNTLTYATQIPAPAAGQVYAVARSTYPYRQIASAINQALHETYIIEQNGTLIADGENLEYALPDGVSDVVGVWLKDQSTNPYGFYKTNHYLEDYGILRFDRGYTPPGTWRVLIEYKTKHPQLTAPTDTINGQVNIEWLRWKAAEYALYWAVRAYGDTSDMRIEELLNRVGQQLEGKWARKPIVRVHTAGG